MAGTKRAPRKSAANSKTKRPAAEKPVGVVTHYYGGIGVAIVKFKKAVAVGTTVAFRGHTTDFSDVISSMQYDHKEVSVSPKGKEVGIKVKDRVREDDKVYLG